MNDFEYTSYRSKKHSEIIGDNKLTEALFNEYLAAVKEPDLNEFLKHQRDQFIQALDKDAATPQWCNLWDFTKEAQYALNTGNVNCIATAFFAVGKAVEALQHPDSNTMVELYEAKVRTMNQDAPLIEKNSKNGFLKQCVEIMATRIWEGDKKQTIKVTTACEMVWPKLVDLAEEYKIPDDCYPDRAAGLKDWVRPVAPEYARRGGRPKKEKK
jgi:hypothetical protein